MITAENAYEVVWSVKCKHFKAIQQKVATKQNVEKKNEGVTILSECTLNLISEFLPKNHFFYLIQFYFQVQAL